MRLNEKSSGVSVCTDLSSSPCGGTTLRSHYIDNVIYYMEKFCHVTLDVTLLKLHWRHNVFCELPLQSNSLRSQS